MSRLTFVLVILLGACTTDDGLGTTELALDSDDSGTVDCADLDHILTCIHHPGTDVCAHADVNHDGAVDHVDLHDAYAALTESGHHCTDPAHHDTADHEGVPH